MNYEYIKKIIPEERIYLNEPMKKHTSFKIGGPAECLIKIQNVEELKEILKIAQENKIPLTIIGNGSNILVRDEGIDGIVLKIEIQKLEIQEQSNTKETMKITEEGLTYESRTDRP